jgi:FtsP/CotA-like multicopper oxidase with cupredoxin domain
MAERYEVVIDFAKYPAGRRIVLGNRSPKNNIVYPNIDKVMAFDVVDDAFDPTDNSVPDSLNPGNPTMALQVADAVKTRSFEFKRDGGQFTINGHTWADVVKSGFTRIEANPRHGDTECTSTWSTSRSSTATAGRRLPTRSARRTSCTSARATPCAC